MIMMEKTAKKMELVLDTPVQSEIRALHYIATKTTPEVIFNPSTGVFRISGRSMPEDSRKFYQPMVEWVKNFAKAGDVEITVEFDLEYFSSSTSVFLLYIMKLFNEMNTNGLSDVALVWKYRIGDEELLEAGREYAEIIGSSFLIHKYH